MILYLKPFINLGTRIAIGKELGIIKRFVAYWALKKSREDACP